MNTVHSSVDKNLQEIPIATVTSSTYLQQTLIMIWSVALSRSSDSLYHFYLLHNSLSQDEQFWLTVHTRALDCCEVSFVDIYEWQQKNALKEYMWDEKTPCFSLFCPYIFPDIEKMLILDGDVVVMQDVANLFQTDLSNAYLGAVYDLDFIGQWIRGNQEYHRYYTQEVPLPYPSSYYQSGVLLMSLRALRDEFPPLFFYNVARERKYRYDDQDIINYYCAGHFLKLDYRWNVIHDNNHYRIRYLMQFAPKEECNAYLASRNDPFIVHYAGDQKPWNSKNCDLYEYYWNVVRRTPFASEYSEPNKTVEPLWKHILKKGLHETTRIIDRMKTSRNC